MNHHHNPMYPEDSIMEDMDGRKPKKEETQEQEDKQGETEFEKLKPLSVGKVATLCNLDRTTIFRWIKRGKLKAWATPGGHYRVSAEDFIDFVREYDIPIEKPMPDKEILRALCIDDDENMLDLYKNILARLWEGFVIETANSGFEGLVKIGSFKPDFIILDLDMEGMDGFDVIKHVKQGDNEDLVVIVVSKFLTNQNIFRIKHLGIDGYIKKPLGILDFAKLVVDVCKMEDKIVKRKK